MSLLANSILLVPVACCCCLKVGYHHHLHSSGRNVCRKCLRLDPWDRPNSESKPPIAAVSSTSLTDAEAEREYDIEIAAMISSVDTTTEQHEQVRNAVKTALAAY